MNKSDLISEVVKRNHAGPSEVARTLDAALDVVRRAVARGERVVLSGFGTFELVRRNPRTGRNPHTGEAVRIPARTVPTFRPGAAFRDAASGRRSRNSKKTAARRRTR